jgi:hypothetical protein
MTAKKKDTTKRGSEAAKPTRKQTSFPSVEWLAGKLLERDCEPERHDIEGTGKTYYEVREAMRLKEATHILGVFASAQKAIAIASGDEDNPHDLAANFTVDQIKNGLRFNDYAKYVAGDLNCARAKRKLAVWIDHLEPEMLCFKYKLRSWHYDNATGFITGAEWVRLHDRDETKMDAPEAFIARKSFAAFDNKGHLSWVQLLGEK